MHGLSESVWFVQAMQGRRLLPNQVVIFVFPGGDALLQPFRRPASPAPGLRGIPCIAVLRLHFAAIDPPSVTRKEVDRIDTKQTGLLDQLLPELFADFVPFGVELVLD